MALSSFLTSTSGPEGTTAFAPMGLYQGGEYPAEVKKAAHSYAGNMADFASSYMGQKGMLDSSFMENALSDAYETGQQRAVGEWTQQQNMFSRWAMATNQLQAQVGPEQEEPSFFQGALGGALAGGSIGDSWGALAGGVLGGLSTLYI